MGKGSHSSDKKRDPQITYRHKVDRITEWYNRLLKCRENPKGDNLINPNTKQEPKRKELKNLSFYIDKIKKVNTNG